MAGAALLAILAAAPAPEKLEVADSPGSVHPLLIGAGVPDLVLKSSEGKDFDLAEAIAKKPTVLILYRGGW
jgi:hypothetical protein